MADNVAITAGSGTTVAADDVGSGVLHQRVKPTWGADGTGNDTNLTTPLPVQQVASGAAVTQVASSATSVTLQASNSARRGLAIYNDSTAVLYVKFGTTASTTSYTVQVPPQSYYEVPGYYYGRVDGIWAAANGNAYVTEVTT